MTFVIAVYKHGAMLGGLMLPDADTTLKLKAAVESLGGEYKANVHVLANAAEHANQDTIAKANAWLTANGFEAVTADAFKAT